MLKPSSYRLPLLLGCFLLSGMAGLIYETAWTQQFSLVFGTSELAVAAVLAAYMAGLALGAGVAGRWANRLSRPLLVYALLELGIAVAALLVPFGLELASKVQLPILGSLQLAPESASLASAIFYLVSAFVVLMAPTTLMGASLPILASFAVDSDEQIGSRVGWLYAINTGGAAGGTLLAAYGLLPRLGLDGTVMIAVAINLAVFLLALMLSRSTKPAAQAVSLPNDSPTQASGPGWILPLVMVSGFISFSYEVLWTRLLSHLLGGTLFAFATMLATFLCGITLGAAIASFLAKNSARSRVGFLMTQLGTALCFLLAFASANTLPDFATGLAAGGSSFANIALLAAATLLPGALFIGASFPFAVRILATSAIEVGAASGRIFAWNTSGAIAGAIGSGFVLLPLFHFDGTVRIILMAGIFVAGFVAIGPKPLLRWPVLVASMLLVSVLVWSPAIPDRVLRTSPLTGKPTPGELTFSAVGRSATTLLIKQGDSYRLTTNGLPESIVNPKGSRFTTVSTAHWLGLLPQASRPDAESVLVIGFGAGRTMEAFAPGVKQIDVIELENEVLNANRLVADLRAYNPFDDPRIRIHLNDARSGLQLAEQKFDAIISQPSHPWTGGASHLFTREFFELVSRRLNDDGVFVQWIGLPFIDQQLLLSLLASLNAAFDYVEMYQPPPGGAILFLAGMQPPMSKASATQALASGTRLWHRLGVFEPQDILAARVLDADASRILSRDAPENLDNHNLLRLHPPGKDFKPLNKKSVRQFLGEHDPLLGWQPEEESLYLIRRLLAVKQTARARQLASGIKDQELAKIAHALVDLSLPQKRALGEQALLQILTTDPGSDEAFYALMMIHQSRIIKDNPPTELVARLATDRIAGIIVFGWQLSTSRQSRAIEKLETELARIQSNHPLYRNAILLRVAWRLASGDANKAAEAIGLFDPVLALATNIDVLLIRARLALVANQPETVLATLNEIAGKVGPAAKRPPRQQAVVRHSIKLLDALPRDSRLRSSIENLHHRLDGTQS